MIWCGDECSGRCSVTAWGNDNNRALPAGALAQRLRARRYTVVVVIAPFVRAEFERCWAYGLYVAAL